MTTHFEIFGLPQRFDLDAGGLERKYRELSLQVHPDRQTAGDAKARRIALEQTTALNDAYKTLKEPVRRAFYLLKLRGIDLDKDEAGTQGDHSGMPPEFLEEILELREELDAAKKDKDVDKASSMGEEVQRRQKHALDAAVAALRSLDHGGGEKALEKNLEKNLKEAAHQMGRVRYFERFLEEVSAIEEEALES